jgi:hypothetical protein
MHPPPCAKVGNLYEYPLHTKAHSYMLAIERHNTFQTRRISKESPRHVASRWMLSCPSKLSWLPIAIRFTKFCTWEDTSLDSIKYISRLCANTMLCTSRSTTSSLSLPAMRPNSVRCLVNRKPIYPKTPCLFCNEQKKSHSNIAIMFHHAFCNVGPPSIPSRPQNGYKRAKGECNKKVEKRSC